jgi:hypothetical protein
MACDIHWLIQVKVKDKEYDDRFQLISDDEYANISVGYDERNYFLFSILADVRNLAEYHGKVLKPISKPSGLPEDFVKKTKDSSDLKLNKEHFYKLKTKCCYSAKYLSYEEAIEEEIFLGDHSHTWYTLDELLYYDWDTKIFSKKQETYRDRIGRLFFDFLDEMKEYCWSRNISFENMRFIIGFDS